MEGLRLGKAYLFNWPVQVTTGIPWLRDLASRGDARAVVTPDATLTYAELGARVDAFAGDLGAHTATRSLVLVEAANTLDSLVAYLGTLRAGHVVLLSPSGSEQARETLSAAYDPDLTIDARGAVTASRPQTEHDLHPDLALLLSTSGSTGSPKLVRLSHDNVAANAEQIADYLDIRESDCAATTLPMHYCYGLSVVHSHLARGAAIALTDLSVVDDCFWQLFREAGATTLPGVPYTFELLDRVGFADMDLPRLRYVTQAGGRMDPERVRHWALTGRERGWDLYVMYGQTEATARMAYLPPDLAVDHPDAIGVPVPGGAFDVVDGELVYTGPNVMLGYAETPADLALGRTVERLHTGDLGHRTPDGLHRVTGRRSRFVKVLGHRIDLDRVESGLRAAGRDARVAGRDGLLVVAVAGADVDRGALRRETARLSGAPASSVRVVVVAEQPVLPTGKPSYAAVLALAADAPPAPAGVRDAAATGGATLEAAPVTRLYRTLLGRDDVTDSSTFVSLGGDSLSYVEVSVRLEEILGTLPASWHVTPVGELDATASARRLAGDAAPGQGGAASPTARQRRTVETSVWLRALAIVLIVGTHAGLFSLQGTAHALLVLVGANVARFAFATDNRRRRLGALGRGLARVVLPTVAVVATVQLMTGRYETHNVFLANWVLGEERLGAPWRFWFVESVVLALVVTIALVAVPAFARADRRWPLGLPLALVALTWTIRLPLYPLPVPRMQGSALVVLFLFFLGWAVTRAGQAGRTRRDQWLVTGFAVVTAGTFSGNPARDVLTLAVVLLLIWKPVTRVPSGLVPLVQVLAAASLHVYVAHWLAIDAFRLEAFQFPGAALAATVASLLVGVGYWWMWTKGPVLLAAIRLKLTVNRCRSTQVAA